MKRFIEQKKIENFDLIVIGGGITGAAVAYDAASRGLKTALVDKKDFGWATSAATSKLIHGGLRYLNNLEFGLVRESLRERKTFENIAPNHVTPIPFLIPGYNRLKNNKWMVRAGMILYDILSFDKGRTWDKANRVPCHKWLSRKDVLKLEKDVRPENLTGGSIYYDCQSVFPERLTLAFVKSASEAGASVANYAGVKSFIRENGKVTGVKVQDNIRGGVKELYGKLTVNCGGPWADIVLNMAENEKNTNGKNDNAKKHQIKRSEGIHIITRQICDKHAVVLWTPEGRHFFLVPWRGHTLIGTTDKDYEGDPDNYRVSKESIEELLRDLNASYGDGKLSIDDVVFAYGGLRPLVDDQTEGSYESSRKYEIYDNAEDGLEGLMTVEGGKYTTSRKLAQSVVDSIEKKLGLQGEKCGTDKKYLAGSEIKDLEAFYKECFEKYSEFDREVVAFLAENFGTDIHSIMDIAKKDKKLAAPLGETGEIAAEAVFSLRNEMVMKLTDLVFRRTGAGWLGDPGKKTIEMLADLAAKELKWDSKRKAAEIKDTMDAFKIK